jgi:hypothetical protein
MAIEPAKSVPIEFDEVLNAYLFVSAGMQSEHQAFINTTTGAIHYSSDAIDAEEELPDDLETSDAYISVPHKNELDLGRDLVFSFVEQELPDDWRTVRDFFGGRGAYGRFKDLLRSRRMLEKWYEFESSATEQALRAWCEDVGVQLSEPPKSTAAG